MGGGIKLAIEENQMSWNDIEKFARQNNWSHSEIEEYKKRHKCGEYRSEIGKDGKFIQHIRIIKLEINHSIGGVNHLLMHTPTSELMKHKLPGGKQSDRDRYTFAPDDSSLWDSLTALREATEELCLHSPRIGVYLAHENRFVSYHLQTEEFITHDEIPAFPSLILESKGYEENTVRSKGRYPGVEQSRTDVFVRGEIRSLSDLGFQTIEHGKEVFRWVPMTDDIVNFLYHMDKTCRKISRRYKNESSEFETSGSLPILPTHAMSVYDSRVAEFTKTTIKPEKKQERDTNKHENVLKSVTRNGMILDPSVPSRSAIRNEIKQQWSRRHKTGELRYRYYNKKRLDLTSQFENLTLLLILKDKVKGKSGQIFTRPLEKKERIQRGTQLLIGELGLDADSQEEFTLSKNLDIFKQDLSEVVEKKAQTEKEIYNQLVARYAYAFLTMNESGCKNCGVSKGEPCQPEHLGEMVTGKSKAELSLRFGAKRKGVVCNIYEPVTLAHGYKSVKDSELEHQLLNLFKQVSKVKSLSWYANFTIHKPSKLKKPRYQRPFVCNHRHSQFTVNSDHLDEILISLGIPLVMRSGISDLTSSRGSDFLFPTETEASIIQQNSLFLLLRRVQLRLFSSISSVWGEDKPGSDRVQRYENTRLILEFLKKGSAKLSTIPIDDLMTREQRMIDVPSLRFERYSKDTGPRYSGNTTQHALEAAYTLNQTEHTVQWSSMDPNRTYPVMSIESSFDEVLSAAFQHGEGVAISVDSWQIDGVDEYVQSKEDEAWRFGPDLFADDVKGARTFSSFLSTLVHHKLLDVKQKNVKQQRRILGVISLDELIRIRKILRKEDRFD